MFRRFIEIIVEEMIDGNRIIFPYDIKMYIGVDTSNRYPEIERFYSPLHVYHNVLISNLKHKCTVRLNKKYTKLLKERVEEGQEYY